MAALISFVKDGDRVFGLEEFELTPIFRRVPGQIVRLQCSIDLHAGTNLKLGRKEDLVNMQNELLALLGV